MKKLKARAYNLMVDIATNWDINDTTMIIIYSIIGIVIYNQLS